MSKQAVVAWIASRRKFPVEIADDADLIESRLINSLDFVEFLLFLEDLSGAEISLDRIQLAHLRTVDAIMRNYFPSEVIQ